MRRESKAVQCSVEAKADCVTERDIGIISSTCRYCTLSNSTSGKNHFHEMNGDVGMAQWK